MRFAFPIALAAVFAAAFGLEVPDAAKGIWRDEATSYFTSSLPHLGDVIARVRIVEFNPPLYFLALHLWIGIFGGTPGAMKALSLLFGAGTLAFVYLIARRASGDLAGLMALAFAGSTSVTALFASEIRPYAMATFFCIASAYAIVRWFASGNDRWLFVSAAASIVLAYTTYIGVFYLLALAAIAAIVPRAPSEKLRFAAWTVVLPLAAAVPVALLERTQAAYFPYAEALAPARKLLILLQRGSEALPITFASPPHLVLPLIGACGLALIAFVALGARRRLRSDARDTQAFVALFASIVFLAVAAGEAVCSLDATRYITPVLPLATIALALQTSLVVRSRRAARFSAGVVICAALIGAFGASRNEASIPKSGMGAVAKEFPVRENPHLALLVTQDESAQTLAYDEGTTRNVHGFFRWDRPDVCDLRGLAALEADPGAVPRALAHIAALPHQGITELVLVQINALDNPQRRGDATEYPFAADLIRAVQTRYTYLGRSDHTATNGEATTTFLYRLAPGAGPAI